MSRLYVRDTLRDELESFFSTLATPFYDSINLGLEIDDNVWATCEFSAYETEHVCYSAGKRIERGICDVYVFVKPGIGDAQAVTQANAVQDYFDRWRTAGIVITNVLPVSEATLATAQSFYGVSVSMEYEFLY